MMDHLKQHNLFAVIGVAIICILAWFYHATFLPNGDVAWDIIGSQRLAAGGSYTHDFFDLNPPLIVYLYRPVVFLIEIFSINRVLALKICVFGLALMSLFVCSFFTRRIFLREHGFLSYVFLPILAITLFILPARDIGQREHLLVLFTLPYFLTVSYRLQGNTLTNWYAIGIGLFAALGFALKPYFLIPFVLVELYVIFYTRRIGGWLRAETLTIIAFLLAYVAFVFIFYSDYIFTVVPLAMRYYYAGFKCPLDIIVTNFLVYFCGIAALFYWVQYKENPYKILSTVLLLAMIGFIGAYVIQQTFWYYHVLPAISMALLLVTLLFGLLIKKYQDNIALIAVSAAVFFAIPLTSINKQYLDGVIAKKNHQPLIAFLHTQPLHQSVYFISASVDEQFASVMYADSTYPSRFLHLFWMPGVVDKTIERSSAFSAQQQARDENFFIRLMAEDLEIKKPKLVFVDVKKYKSHYLLHRFEYLPYLLKNRSFQEAWQPYHYLTTLEASGSVLTDDGSWDLYLAQDIQQISPKKINGQAVILTGKGPVKSAYYVYGHQFLKNKTSLAHTQVRLTKLELWQLPQQGGKVNRNKKNDNLIRQLVNRALFFPAYKYQIYQREDTKATGIS